MRVLSLFVATFLNAATITTLFDSIKKTPDYKIDEIALKKANINKKSVINSLYPTITLNSSYEHYSIPTALTPLPPTESTKLIQTNSALPFSKNAFKIAFSASMPLFVKEIYENKKKVEYLVKASKLQVKLNYLKKEAILVNLVSNLNYLYTLKKALLKKKNSIQKTIDSIKVGVDNGVIPEFKLIRLKDSLNDIEIKIDELKTKIDDTKSNIYKLTLINLDKPLKFNIQNIPKSGNFFTLKILNENLKASLQEIKSKEAKRYPKIFLKSDGYRVFAKAYNNDEDIAKNYAKIGIYLSFDLFNKKNSSDIQKAKIEKLKATLEFQKTKKDLTIDVKNYLNKLKIINNSINLAYKKITLKKELLNSAKTAFILNRMSVDEYLSYENELYDAYANLANLQALKKVIVANLALIYGKDLKKVFK